MRPIFTAQLDQRRPVLVLTRAHVVEHLTRVTVAPITSRVRGLRTEVVVGIDNGLDQESVVNCDNIVTVDRAALGTRIGSLLDHQEPELAAAIAWAFDLASSNDARS
ncbi:MAG: type II toxin-antitoxin system PemK/MazF family toxin [Ilumatobacteraceae bacterium]